MSGALLDAPTLPLGIEPRTEGPCAGGARPAGGSRPTLEELLASTLQAARTQAEADCPLCDGPMHFVDGAAHCDACGSTLS